MQTYGGGAGLTVVVGDVLALRGTGLAAAETWALLCQAAQALQDLFLSNGGVVGGSRSGPVVTPHTLELTQRGRVSLQIAPPETARAYLPPEYRPGRVYSDTDSEKMWMYSLGRALLDTTPRISALTGTVSVSPSSALQSVLAAMTEPDPRRRASLMNLLDVISEYCQTRLQSKPFTHIVMDMYREVVRSPQYEARKRAARQRLNGINTALNAFDIPNAPCEPTERYSEDYYCHRTRPEDINRDQCIRYFALSSDNDHYAIEQDRLHPLARCPPPSQCNSRHHRHYNRYHDRYRKEKQQRYEETEQQKMDPQRPSYSKNRHRGTHRESSLFQLRSHPDQSRSHPNLTSLREQYQRHPDVPIYGQFRSQLDIQCNGLPSNPSISSAPSMHSRCQQHRTKVTHSRSASTNLQHARSMNLPVTVLDRESDHANIYGDPIYALPVKPFLSSQDVRVIEAVVESSTARLCEEEYPKLITYRHAGKPSSSLLRRQHSNPQLARKEQQDDARFKRYSQPSIATETECHGIGMRREEEEIVEVERHGKEEENENAQQQNPVSSDRIGTNQRLSIPPRIITSVKKQPLSDAERNRMEQLPKLARNIVRNGPRARRGKAVQRAPSRLYRTIGAPMRCFNKAQCVGPEFVVRANQPPKLLSVGQPKTGNLGRIVVIMLTGQRLEVTCDPQKVTAGDLFQAIVRAEKLEENFTLGLAVLLAGDFAMLPPETKLNKVAPPGWLNSGKSKGLLGLPTSFMLYLRLRFFLPSLRGIRNWISKHLLYLQIRRCILEQQLVCSYHELIHLTGLALQAEFGDYNVNEHACGDYFLLEHYVPESLILNVDHGESYADDNIETLKARLHQAHRDRRGLDSNKAEEMFVAHAQSLPDYGSHYYIATVDSKELDRATLQRRKECQKKKGKNIDDGSSGDRGNIYENQKSIAEPRNSSKVEYSCHLISRDNARNELLPPALPFPLPPTSRNIFSNVTRNGKSTTNRLTESSGNANGVYNIRNSDKKIDKGGKSRKTENVWLAVHARGLKLFERGGEPSERIHLVEFQWKDIQTLSYSKSCLVVYSKLNGKRCKFKLRMDHRKSYFAFKLASLHHRIFLRLRSELTSLQGLERDFGVVSSEQTDSNGAVTSPSRSRNVGKLRIIMGSEGTRAQQGESYPMQLEEYQNKENEKPLRDGNAMRTNEGVVYDTERFRASEEDALYARVNVRLEPEGESRDTEDEDESERRCVMAEGIPDERRSLDDGEKIYGYPRSKAKSDVDIDRVGKPEETEDLYAAINKVTRRTGKEILEPSVVISEDVATKSMNNKTKASSLPNYGVIKRSNDIRTPSLPRRLGVKMGTRAIYSSLVHRDIGHADGTGSVSVESDAESSIRSLSAQSAESPMPEAYVLDADIRTDDETFRIAEDESMSASLMARLEELSFAEERILHRIELERGQGGSIGLQVTEGNDGGVYVQAVSVGGSADMAGNVNKGDRIVAINGQSLLNLGYEDALKMLQSSSKTVVLVLSQAATVRDKPETETGYLRDIGFDVSSEIETSSMTKKWIARKTMDAASVQNTSSAYSSAASSAMGNHNANIAYSIDFVDNNDVKSASMLLGIEDFDVSTTSRQVFI